MNPLGRVVPDGYEESTARTMTRSSGQVLARAALVAGPVLAIGLFVLAKPSAQPATSADNAGDQGRDAGGWAQMYVRSWLSADRDTSAGIERFYPSGIKTQRAPGTQVPVETSVVSLRRAGEGTWSVVVGAHLMTKQKGGEHQLRMQCQQVTVLEEEAGYVAAALPAPVACPSTLSVTRLDYSHSAPVEGPIGEAVRGFLSTYLTGQGDFLRYITQDADLARVDPAPYVAAHVSDLRTHEEFEPGQADRPLDGVKIRVLARAWGYDPTGETQPLEYALTLVASAGSWEVARIDPAPLVAAPTSESAESTSHTQSSAPTSELTAPTSSTTQQQGGK